MRMPGDRVLVTGSAGHLGEALVRVLRAVGRDVVGLDLLASPFTTIVGSIADRATVRGCLAGAGAVLHPATLHKPHVGSHSRQDFVDTNISGTLTLLEEAAAAGVGSFVFTSTTSAFGRALTPAPGAPAAWITEEVIPVPRNIYGVTKTAAEELCALIHASHGLPVVILRTSRFFPEPDDADDVRNAYPDANIKANEFLYRRADIQDVADAHLLAMDRAPAIGFGRYIVSATTPFYARRPARAPRRRARRGAPPVPRPGGRVCAPGLADVRPHRPGLRERARPRGSGLGTGLRFPPRARPAQGRRGSAQPASPSGRRQGVSPGLHRPVYDPLVRLMREGRHTAPAIKEPWSGPGDLTTAGEQTGDRAGLAG
jgi:UDP-glucose 4-epimerase